MECRYRESTRYFYTLLDFFKIKKMEIDDVPNADFFFGEAWLIFMVVIMYYYILHEI